MLKLLPLLILSASVCAGPYVEIGVAAIDTSYTHLGDQYKCLSIYQSRCFTYGRETRHIGGPIGLLEVGYEYKYISAFFLHISSIPDKEEKGMNLFGLKLRFE